MVGTLAKNSIISVFAASSTGGALICRYEIKINNQFNILAEKLFLDQHW